MDGSNQPIDGTLEARPVDAIRADLAHPHTAALLQLGAATAGDGPIGRLLRDVEPLLGLAGGWEHVAAARTHLLRTAEGLRDEAEAECADLWDAVDKARSVLDDALARIRRRGQDEAHDQVAEVVAAAMTEQGHADV